MRDIASLRVEQYETKSKQELSDKCARRKLDRPTEPIDMIAVLIKNDIATRKSRVASRPRVNRDNDLTGDRELKCIDSDAAFNQRNKDTPSEIKIAGLKKALDAEENYLVEETKVINDARDKEVAVLMKRLEEHKLEAETAQDGTTTRLVQEYQLDGGHRFSFDGLAALLQYCQVMEWPRTMRYCFHIGVLTQN